MTTTKGVQYLHNFFRLDGEGLVYIWPMFDPKAVIQNPDGLLEWLRGEGYYDVITQGRATHGGHSFANRPDLRRLSDGSIILGPRSER